MTLGVLQLRCDIAVNQEVCVLFCRKPSVTACFSWNYFHMYSTVFLKQRGERGI